MSGSVLPLIYSTLRTKLIPLLLLCLHLAGQGCWGGKCSDSVVVLRGPHGVIQTPNFPRKFDTPINCKWIIDSTEVDLMLAPNQRKSIIVYFTQMNLKENLKFVEYDNYSSEWQTTESVVHYPDLRKTRIWQTSNRYLGIEFSSSTPYQSHLRTRDYFLDEYGFNITYEIVPEHVQRNDTCSFPACHFAGKCFVTHDFQKFYCDCLSGHFGPLCEYNNKSCDPGRNISFCARGTCRNLGSWSSVCYCPQGYTGPKCEHPIRPVIKECPGPYCDEVCPSSEPPKRPCECHYGRIVPQGWVRYEGKMKLSGTTLSQWDFRNVSKPSDARELNILNRIEQVLAHKLQSTNASLSNVSIISVGPASEFIFRFFGDPSAYNASFNALAHLKSTGKIDDELQLGGAFNFDIQPSLSLKGVTLSTKKIIRTMDDFSITCEAVGSENLKFLWFKDDIPINSSLATRYIYEDHIPKNNHDRSRSVLILYQVSIYDRGTFTCQASDMGEMQCASLFVDVLLPPIIEVEPLSLTLVGNDSTIITCFANNDSGNHSCEYTWFRDGERIEKGKVGAGKVVVEDLDYPRGSLLRILQADSSATYSCVVANYAGTSQRDVRVEVLDSAHSPSCRRELDSSSRVVWEWTAVNQTAMAKCPSGYTGFAQRTCQMQGLKPHWSKSDLSRCMSSPLKTINNTLQKVKMGFAVHNSAENLLELFATYLEKKKFLYSGEGDNIIHVLNDAANYAQEKKRVGESFSIFLKSITQLLGYPESCVHQRSLVTLINLVQSMAKHYSMTLPSSDPYSFKTPLLVVERIPEEMLVGQRSPFPYDFPQNKSEYPDWLNLRLQLPVNWDWTGPRDVKQVAGLLFTAFRNVTDLLSPSQKIFTVKAGKSAEVVSPLVTMMFPKGYSMRENSHIYLEFDVPPRFLHKLSTGKINLTCGAMETKRDTIRWTMNACIFKGMVNSTAFCQCDTFGQYALLSVRIGENDKGNYVPNFHWSVLAGSIVCIIGCALALLCISVHLEFKLKSNNLYFLKVILCLSLISSILLILSVPIDTTSVALSTALCTLLLVSLCCQLTKSLYILLSAQLELFPWLRSVSLVTLLGAVSFGCVLPVWTAAAAVSHSQATDPERRKFPVLSEGSAVFNTFAATVSLVVLAFLFLYYKAVLHLRTIRHGNDPDKNYLTDYRLSTLHRALLLTLGTLITILAMVLYGNITDGVIYQYFFGCSTFCLGILVLVVYTVKSEYPIPVSVVKYLYPTRQFPTDPENAKRTDKGLVHSNRSLEKRFDNGGVSTSLLERQASANNTGEGVDSGATLDTCMGSSLSNSLVTGVSRQDSIKRTGSALTMERSSFSSTSNKMPRSMASTMNGLDVGTTITKNFPPKPSSSSTGLLPLQSCNKKSKSVRSHSAYVPSSVGKNNSSISESFRPQRGRCLLSEVSQSDYVMPSISSQLATEKTTTGSLSSAQLFSGTYVDPSVQYNHTTTCIATTAVAATTTPATTEADNERDISQLMTFRQQILEAADGKKIPLESNIPSNSFVFNNGDNGTDPGTTSNNQSVSHAENVKVHFSDESSPSFDTRNSRSHHQPQQPPSPPGCSFVSFHKEGVVVVSKESEKEVNGERNKAYLHPTILQVDNSSRKSLSTGSDEDEDVSSFSCKPAVGLNRCIKDRARVVVEPMLDRHDPQPLKAENLVKRISHDLDIILDRPKIGGRKMSDVQL